MINEIKEDIISVTSIRYSPTPISLKQVGFPKIQFFMMTWYLAVLSTLFFLNHFVNNSNTDFYLIGSSFSFWLELPASVAHYLLFTAVGVLFFIISFILSRMKGISNVSFNSIYSFGRGLGITDSFLLVFIVVCFIAGLYTGFVHWFYILVIQFICLSIIINLIYSKSPFEFEKISPELEKTPEPEALLADKDNKETDESDQESSEIPNEENTVDENYSTQNYSWTSKYSGSFNISNLKLSLADFKQAQKINYDILSKNNGSYSTWQDYVDRVHQGITPDVNELFEKIYEYTKGKSPLEAIDIILSFVHEPNFKYEYDQSSKNFPDYARFPIETLIERIGDCECLSILAATLFKLHGFNTALILLKTHCVAGVGIPDDIDIPGTYTEKNGVKYFYCEATGAGWSVGETPINQPEEDVYPV